jgi:hypothetical protein
MLKYSFQNIKKQICNTVMYVSLLNYNITNRTINKFENQQVEIKFQSFRPKVIVLWLPFVRL